MKEAIYLNVSACCNASRNELSSGFPFLRNGTLRDENLDSPRLHHPSSVIKNNNAPQNYTGKEKKEMMRHIKKTDVLYYLENTPFSSFLLLPITTNSK
jgi:hypothetical protein